MVNFATPFRMGSFLTISDLIFIYYRKKDKIKSKSLCDSSDNKHKLTFVEE